jgi:hypothetical protein
MLAASLLAEVLEEDRPGHEQQHHQVE